MLWNPSSETVQMVGWNLRDSQSEEELPAITLPAGATVLVTAAETGGAALPPASQRITLAGHIANGLRNAGDSLTLLDSDGQIIDALSWGDDRSIFDPAIATITAGQSLQRNGPTDTDTANDWSIPVPSPTAVVLDMPERSTSVPATTNTPDQSRKVNTTTTPTALVAASAPLAAQSPATSRIVLSEIAPDKGWVEIYNHGPEPVDLKRWSLTDGSGVATVMLPDVLPVAPNGFIVVQAPALNLTRPDTSVALRDPAGTVVDMVAIVPIKPDHSLSRFPVHGGGWAADTQLTAGQFNAPAPTADPSTLPTPPQGQSQTPTEMEADIQPGLFKPWTLPLALFCAGLALLIALLRRRMS